MRGLTEEDIQKIEKKYKTMPIEDLADQTVKGRSLLANAMQCADDPKIREQYSEAMFAINEIAEKRLGKPVPEYLPRREKPAERKKVKGSA